MSIIKLNYRSASKACFFLKITEKLVYRLKKIDKFSTTNSKFGKVNESSRTNFDATVKLNKLRTNRTLKNKMSEDHKLIQLLKPLNVLVYIDNQKYETKSTTVQLNRSNSTFNTDLATTQLLSNEFCDHLFSAIQTFLTYFLSQKFTIYPTSLAELNRRAWFNTTKLLIVVQNDLNESLYLEQSKNEVINQFKNQTGNVIIINRSLLSSSTDLKDCVLNVNLLKNMIRQKLGNEIVYENFKIPDLTVHYVYSNEISKSTRLVNYLEKNLDLKAKLCENLNDMKADFNVQLYLEHLEETNELGRNLIVADVTKSTQPIAENAPFIDGLVVITNQQTDGKGRGKNQWLSPEGSISFTYAVSVPMNSNLFKCLALFQHVNALAILLAIKKFDKMDELDLKIKWPNDIYYKSQHKLVGILTNSQFQGNCAKFFIGTGINLSNDKPTYSLKNIFEEEFKEQFDISKEQLIAEILNQINNLIKLINSQGKDKIVDLYYENWMLTDKIIKLDDGKQAHILGLDEDGYLRVNLLEDGEIVSLLPDGNRFDIMEQMVINPTTN